MNGCLHLSCDETIAHYTVTMLDCLLTIAILLVRENDHFLHEGSVFQTRLESFLDFQIHQTVKRLVVLLLRGGKDRHNLFEVLLFGASWTDDDGVFCSW